MKELKSPTMRKLLRSGIRKAKKIGTPSDGTMFNLIYKTLKNGWHYQVEYIHDGRMFESPYVAVFAFKPPVVGAAAATFVLYQELNP
jgi:hypothetical protein